jgi:predicted NAD-dependent protein-ADP-ribosyltransferase YbiA (DUF1768 family)
MFRSLSVAIISVFSAGSATGVENLDVDAVRTPKEAPWLGAKAAAVRASVETIRVFIMVDVVIFQIQFRLTKEVIG